MKLIWLLLLATLSCNAFAAQAFWTGEAQYGITALQGVSCEYKYNGGIFRQSFPGRTCPFAVTVQ